MAVCLPHPCATAPFTAAPAWSQLLQEGSQLSQQSSQAVSSPAGRESHCDLCYLVPQHPLPAPPPAPMGLVYLLTNGSPAQREIILPGSGFTDRGNLHCFGAKTE